MPDSSTDPAFCEEASQPQSCSEQLNGGIYRFRTGRYRQALQIVSDLSGGLVAKLAILLDSLGDDLFQIYWKIGPHLACGNGELMQDSVMDLRHVSPLKARWPVAIS